MAHTPSSTQKTGLGNQGSALQGYADTGWLARLNGRSLVVCRIILGKNLGGGTGFLIGKDLIMTNNHVLSSLESARDAQAQFFYTKDSEGVQVPLNPDDFFCTSPSPDLVGFEPIKKGALDFTVVSIHSHPKIREVSHLAFSIFGTPIPQKEWNANIIHHPLNPDGTSYQRVSFRENLVKEVSMFTLHYATATLPGSSGAPVIDDEGNLIALHRATCTHILKALLKDKMLTALLQELFAGIPFVGGALTLEQREFKGRCATIGGSPLYVFSDGELKGQYYHEGHTPSPASLFRLINTQHPSPKKWALDFINARLLPEEQLADYHKECNTAVPIKAIHDYLKCVGLLTQIEARYQESQKSLPTLLKESYLQKCGSLPLVLTNAAFPIESFFTQLSIVSHASQAKKEVVARQRDPNMVEKDSLREIYARLCSAEKSIEIHNLFDEKTRRVLVLGRAGIGKSTLCQKIAYDWASGTLFDQKFAVVYHIKLRDFNSQDKILGDPHKWMSQLIAEACYAGAHQEKVLKELQTSPEKTLLIFDGWDEASAQLTQALEVYLLNTQAHYLVTSRPGVTSKIHNNFDLIVENMGFTRMQVESYAEKFFAHTQCAGLDAFLKMLHSRSNLFTIAHVPIQLQILCTLWQKGEQDFPQTLTPLFSKIVRHLFEWEQNKNPQKKEIAPLKRLFLYQALGEISLKGLESKQLIISDTLVVNALIEKSLEDGRFEKIRRQDLISTGLVKECGTNGALYFLHLTYQEYCIAHYISSLPQSSLDKKQAQDKQRAFIQTYRYQPHFHLVIRMLAGCMWEASKDLQTMELFFEWLYSGHTDLIGAYQTELALSCLDECRSEELEKRIWEKYKIGDFVGCIMEREATRDYLSRLMALSTPAFTQVAQHLDKVDTQEKNNKKFLCWFFDHVQQYANETRFPQILGMVQKAQSDPEKDVHCSAAKALGKLAAHVEKGNIPQILNMLQVDQSYEEWKVRRSTAAALKELAPHAGKENIPQILNMLQADLSYNEGGVRERAAEAIREFASHAGKKNIPQILNMLQEALSATNWVMRNSAVAALKALAPHAGKENIPQILNMLQAVLKDKMVNAVAALKALAPHAGKENIPQILNMLQVLLSEEDRYMRKNAAAAIRELAPHAGKKNIPQILNRFQAVLSDQDSDVRQAAAEALGELAAHAGKENIPQILNRLQKALSDWDHRVRQAAAEALGELAAHAGKENITQILNSLQKALSDQIWDVRQAAAEALGELAAHAGPENIPQILNSLQKALSDQDPDVRQSAAEAIRELAAHAGKENIPQFLDILQKVFSDRDSDKHKNAAAEAIRELAAHAGKENIPQFLDILQAVLSDQTWNMCQAAAAALRELVAHAGKENIPQILNMLQAVLSDQDSDVRKKAAEALGELAAHVGKENILQSLDILQKAFSDEDRYVRHAAAEALGELAAHTGKENIPQILNMLQKALKDKNHYVRINATLAIGKLAAHAGKENIPQILNMLQKALSDRYSNVCSCAAQVTFGLKPEWLLFIFTTCPKLNTFIFEHFINQSIPLYCVENSTGHFIHTSDTCSEAFDLKQLGVLSNRCTVLYTNTWTESTEFESAKEIVVPTKHVATSLITKESNKKNLPKPILHPIEPTLQQTHSFRGELSKLSTHPSALIVQNPEALQVRVLQPQNKKPKNEPSTKEKCVVM